MKIPQYSIAVLLAAFSVAGCSSTPADQPGFNCSDKAFRTLQEDVERAERNAKPLYEAAELDPTESNTAAAANAASLVATAEAHLAVNQAACRADL